MRFFFDYKAKHHTIYDYTGEDFTDGHGAFDFAEATVHHLKSSLMHDWNTYSVEVRDAEGKKYFSLPVTPGDSSIQLIDTESQQPGPRRLCLLIIEDRDVHAAVIGRSAAKLDFAVTNAHSYENACEILSTDKFDCITLDLGLGDHAGFDILRLIASIQSRAQIVVISGTDKEIRDDVVELGRLLGLNVYASIPKPIDLSALTGTLTHIQNHLACRKETKAIEEAGGNSTSAAVH
jgi:two-component system, chemotaxis family, chemotaxis protein CheY